MATPTKPLRTTAQQPEAADNQGRPAVSVVVAARNAMATLPRALEAIVAQATSAPFEVIVVDDGSSDGTFEFASSYGSSVRAVRNSGKRGPGNTRNAGVDAARADVIAFTDSDCYPEPDWIERGLSALESAEIVQGAVSPDPGAARRPFDRTLVISRDDGYYRTANLFVRRDVFDSIGGFEDWVVESGGDPPFGWRAPADGRATVPARKSIGEDCLFGWHARRRGARIVFAPDAVVHHAVFATSALDSIKFRWHWRHMAGVVKMVPELREHTLFARLFFSRRTAQFDLALLAIFAWAITRRRGALVAALPYLRLLYHTSRHWQPRDKPRAVVGTLGEDAAALAAFAIGSVAWRSPVL